MISERASTYCNHLRKAAQKEKFRMCKADVLSDVLWEELDNVVQILEPLKLFIRDNDGSLKLSDGNALGHAYYNFYKLDQYYLSSNAIKAEERSWMKDGFLVTPNCTLLP